MAFLKWPPAGLTLCHVSVDVWTFIWILPLNPEVNENIAQFVI